MSSRRKTVKKAKTRKPAQKRRRMRGGATKENNKENNRNAIKENNRNAMMLPPRLIVPAGTYPVPIIPSKTVRNIANTGSDLMAMAPTMTREQLGFPTRTTSNIWDKVKRALKKTKIISKGARALGANSVAEFAETYGYGMKKPRARKSVRKPRKTLATRK